MVSIHPLSIRSVFSQVTFLNAMTPLQKVIIGVALFAFAALAACYYLCTRCIKNQATEQATDKDADSPKQGKVNTAQQVYESPKFPPLSEMKPRAAQTEEAKSEESSYNQDQIKATLDRYKKAKKKKDDTAKAECEEYFKRAVTTDGRHIIDVYNGVKTKPKLIGLILDEAFRASADWNLRPVVEKQLLAIFNALQGNPTDLDLFVAGLIERMREPNGEGLRATLRALSVPQVEELTHRILKKEKKPLEVLEYLRGHVFYEEAQSNRVLALCLDNCRPSAELQKFLDDSRDNYQQFLDLSPQQLQNLLLQWTTHLDNDRLYKQLRNLLDLYFVKKHSVFVQLIDMCLNLEMDFDDFIVTMKKTSCAQTLCCLYVMQVLCSGAEDELKTSKMGAALSILNPKERDDYYSLGCYLAEKCPTEYLNYLITVVPALVRAYVFFEEGFFLTLLRDSAASTDRIQKAFEPFWYRNFLHNDKDLSVAKLLLPEIKTEVHLDAIYRAIPKLATDRDKIIALLKNEHVHNDKGGVRRYKVALPQDVIDRIVV